MAARRGAVEMDFIIDRVQHLFQCRVLWSEGRPCLEYDSEEELNRIAEHVLAEYDTELLDVFFTAIASLPMDE